MAKTAKAVETLAVVALFLLPEWRLWNCALFTFLYDSLGHNIFQGPQEHAPTP